jgi:transcriptional regulator with XRE-family HTH domain
MRSPVGGLLQQWRQLRHKSQLTLAADAGVSPRHLCFVETGRARPSRDMVLVLADALDVPFRERNELLLAAGFAPIYREAGLDDADIAPARAALEAILRQQEPYPAVVMNRGWDILKGNAPADRFFAWLLGDAAGDNVIRLMFGPLRPFVTNWDDVAESLIRRMHREVVGGVRSETVQRLLDDVLSTPGVPARLRRPRVDETVLPIIPVRFAKDGRSFNYFSTITTLGTPQDITLQELRVECFFPMDPETERNARRPS